MNETCGRSSALGEGGMPQYDNSEDRQLDRKVNEACGRSNALGEGGMPQYDNSEDRQLDKKGEWNLWKV